MRSIFSLTNFDFHCNIKIEKYEDIYHDKIFDDFKHVND